MVDFPLQRRRPPSSSPPSAKMPDLSKLSVLLTLSVLLEVSFGAGASSSSKEPDLGVKSSSVVRSNHIKDRGPPPPPRKTILHVPAEDGNLPLVDDGQWYWLEIKAIIGGVLGFWGGVGSLGTLFLVIVLSQRYCCKKSDDKDEGNG